MNIYCVYITFYTGKQLPPFYIGYSTVKKILNGYHGSVVSKKYKQIWKEELKTNPHLFKTIILYTFNSLFEAKEREEYIQRYFNVHRNPMFINLNISGKLFGAQEKHSKETKEKISLAHKGKIISRESIEKANKTKKERYKPYNISKEHKEKIGKALSNYKKGKTYDQLYSNPEEILKKRQLQKSKQWIIIYPDKTEKIITNLSQFCIDNNLNRSCMDDIAKGRQKTHRGYSVKATWAS